MGRPWPELGCCTRRKEKKENDLSGSKKCNITFGKYFIVIQEC